MRAFSISLMSRTFTGVNSTPNAGGTDRIAPNWPIPAAIDGSRMTPNPCHFWQVNVGRQWELPFLSTCYPGPELLRGRQIRTDWRMT
jgi:hypothetical protein